MSQSDGDATPVKVTTSESLDRYYRERFENVRRQLPEVARQLKEAGVRRVSIEYDGCGDSGQIECIKFFDADNQRTHPLAKLPWSKESLLDLFYDILEARYGGWENNDGAFGEFTWDLAADSLHHIHSIRFTDTETTEVEGL